MSLRIFISLYWHDSNATKVRYYIEIQTVVLSVVGELSLGHAPLQLLTDASLLIRLESA